MKKISLFDRIVLAGLLPKEGSFTDLIIAKDTAKKIDLTQEEIKKYGVQVRKEQIVWNEEGQNAEFKISFTEAEESLIKTQLKKLDEEKKATQDHLHLYEVFLA